MKTLIPGFATSEGTLRFKSKQSSTAQTHFRTFDELALSDLGMGTYLGKWDDATDQLYAEALFQAVSKGVNVIDTAINYRFMRSERAIGKAIQKLIAEKKIERDEIFVATKGGYLSFDGAPPKDPKAYFAKTYFDSGIISPADIVDGSHCMHPKFIAHEIEKSRENLGLATIDAYYLHNIEYQTNEIPRVLFDKRIFNAFEMLELAVAEKKIQRYGLATWDGFRIAPSELNHLSLRRVLEIAREVGGDGHHFKIVQLPFNFKFKEAATETTQETENDLTSFLHLAQESKIIVMASVPLFQGRLLNNLPFPLQQQFGENYATDAQRAIAFVAGTPGICSALVGMSKTNHVEENSAYFQKPRLSETTWRKVIDALA